ncbi:MAG: DUF1513 domain-containing protein [Marinosulfonomonas sp.]
MANRRQFLAGLLAAGMVPKPSWADAGGPAYLSAAGLPSGGYALCGIGANREVLFQITLPSRGHAAAAHPTRPEAVAFARRPGTFAIVLDCSDGRVKTRLESPEGRHFYGHGAFSGDGQWLFTTENDYEAAEGRIGVWDVAAGYARVDEFASGGTGPHDLKRLPGSEVLVVANGGIETHPDAGRAKLNIATMQPNLSYLEDGQVVEQARLSPDLHRNSIRHLAVSETGQVAFGMQWQGDGAAPALVGLHRRGAEVQLFDSPEEELHRMGNYIGSIAFSEDESRVAVTSPRGGRVQQFDVETGVFAAGLDIEDACGVAAQQGGFVVTTGQGNIDAVTGQQITPFQVRDLMWDNHLIPV